jgi:hypothetical protein
MSTQLEVAASIARLCLHDPTHFSIQQSQTLHRLMLLQHWNIGAGSKVLEIGCGQGDCTTVLANAVGEQGSVVAVDPAELDYGASSRFLPGCLSWMAVAECSGLMLLQVPRTPSAKPRVTFRKARWVGGLLGSNKPPWTTFPPSPPPLPTHRRPPMTERPLKQQCLPTAYGTSPPPRSSFPLSALSSSTANVSFLQSGP